MITHIHLKNYKSYGDVRIDFTNKKGEPKKIIIIYGENGVGKTNLISAVAMLQELFQTMQVKEFLDRMLADEPDILKSEDISEFLKDQFKTTETIIRDNKMIDSCDSMSIELGFSLDGKKGKYLIETDDTTVIHERLEYKLNRNSGVYFDITEEKTVLSKSVFLNNKNIEELSDYIDKYWGKHCFISILNYDKDNKKKEYYSDKLSANFINVLNYLNTMSCYLNKGSKTNQILSIDSGQIPYIASGKIKKKNEYKLDSYEIVLSELFTKINPTIDSVFYERKEKDDEIKYTLYFRRKIFNQVRDIRYSLEAFGNKMLLDIIPFFFVAYSKSAVVLIDEFDTGLHDQIVINLLKSLDSSLPDTSQMIITTHNTSLMVSDLSYEYFYDIIENDLHDKEVKCLLSYDGKMNNKSNLRNKYFHGDFGWSPNENNIDFMRLTELIHKYNND